MRIRSAKQRAQRIDLAYFKRPHPFRRWRTLLSIGVPAAGLVWLAAMAAAGSREPYSSGPVSRAHAFIENKCETCHVRDASAAGSGAFRAHVTDAACVTCHDAPAHPGTSAGVLAAAAHDARQAPSCATCHREHNGRIDLARSTADGFCVQCHGSLPASRTAPSIASRVTGFPSGHPEINRRSDAGTIRFNHQVHLGDSIRGPSGPRKLECTTCHVPELARSSSNRALPTGLMGALSYERQCADCHPMFFDERLDAQAPHEEPKIVRAAVGKALADYIAAHPDDVGKPDPPPRRVPLNFPLPPEPPARTPQEWIERRAARAEALLWSRTCAECHLLSSPRAIDGLPVVAAAGVTQQWMPRARFDHAPHQLLECVACHRAQDSRLTSDVLMPDVATCATCHAGKGADSSCAACHGYHEAGAARPVRPSFRLLDFQ